MKTKRLLMILVAITAAAAAGYLAVGMERHCLLYPGIDTRYAAGFSEQKFAQVRSGMSKEEVLGLLGDPFGGNDARSSSRWFYTQDGKCFWADWAWLGREVVFEGDHAIEKISRVYHD